MWTTNYVNTHQSGEGAVFTCLLTMSDSLVHSVFCTSKQVVSVLGHGFEDTEEKSGICLSFEFQSSCPELSSKVT